MKSSSALWWPTWCSPEGNLAPELAQVVVARDYLSAARMEQIGVVSPSHVDGRVLLFRGQLLELLRWALAYCPQEPSDVDVATVEDRPARFLKTALHAKPSLDRPGRRPFLIEGIPVEEGRQRVLGPVRRMIEGSLTSEELGVYLARGWALFRKFLPSEWPEFEAAYERLSGLPNHDTIRGGHGDRRTICRHGEGP